MGLLPRGSFTRAASRSVAVANLSGEIAARGAGVTCLGGATTVAPGCSIRVLSLGASGAVARRAVGWRTIASVRIGSAQIPLVILEPTSKGTIHREIARHDRLCVVPALWIR